MPDSITETTTIWFGERIKGALAGIVIWPVIIFFACSFLWTNEANNAHMIDGLNEGKSSYREVKLDSIDPNFENKLVHISGNATTSDILNDSDFSLSVPAIKLSKKVEMYQWKEEKKQESKDNYGGSSTTTTTYNYKKVWEDSSIDSSSFNQQAWHTNSSIWKYRDSTYSANSVKIGAYSLTTPLIAMIEANDPLDFTKYIPKINTGEIVTWGTIYVWKDISIPEIGDLRVTFTVANNNIPISILGKQSANSLGSYIAKSWSDITRIDSGTKTAGEMFQAAEQENTILAWIFRVIGIICIFIGFSLFFKILPMLAAIIPPLSWIIGAWVTLVSLILTVIVGWGIIVLAWFAYRPFLSVGIMIIMGLLVWGIYYKIHQKKNPISLGNQVMPSNI